MQLRHFSGQMTPVLFKSKVLSHTHRPKWQGSMKNKGSLSNQCSLKVMCAISDSRLGTQNIVHLTF